MEVTILPKDLKLNTADKLQLYNYKSYNDIQKTKISLSTNTISFLRAGKKEVIGDDKTIRINNESFLIMKSGNCLMTEKVSDANKYYQSILLFFSDEEALSFLEHYKLYSSNPIEAKSFYVFEYDNFIINFVESLEQILTLPKAVQKKLLSNKFEELMLYLTHKNEPTFLNSLVNHLNNKDNRFTNIVENNKYNKLSLQELSFLCSMSVSTFKRVFFKHYQTTPMKWFSEQRLNHAAFLLSTRIKRPIELYETAGYENFSNFVQAFKKQFGKTPKQYEAKN